MKREKLSFRGTYADEPCYEAGGDVGDTVSRTVNWSYLEARTLKINLN